MELLQQQQQLEERKQEILRLFESSTEEQELQGSVRGCGGAGGDLAGVDQCEEAAAAPRESDGPRPAELRDAAGGAVPAPPVGGGAAVKAEVGLAAASGPGRRKRGRPPKNIGQPTPLLPRLAMNKADDEEDVCFICFDGGNLVLCDRRGCPKAYHPACIKREEEFFRSRAKWNCGWHICSTCQRAAHHMCYTCTYSLCKNCTKGADYVCVRGNKGLCGTCMKTIMLIENIRLGNEEKVQVDFDDKSSWEYLFKVYWIYLKEKLSLSTHELIKAKNPWNESDMMSNKQVPPRVVYGNSGRKGFGLDDFNRYGAADCSNRRKTKKQVEVIVEEAQSEHLNPIDGGPSSSSNEGIAWASKELLEFVALMKGGNTSILSPLDVQKLLLEYIRKNNLRDPHQKCQILCDSILFSLFGKAIVGHIEMLKLLESHFLVKNKPRIDGFIQGPVVDAVTSQMNVDLNNHELMVGTDKRRKTRKKIDERVLQANPDDYAAIDGHNIRLIYLERNMMDKMIDDSEKFDDMVVGSFVRIRISGGDQKQDHHRLVRVVGSSRVEETNDTGGKSASIKLEILNLDKKEAISINEISSEEFSEDECRWLQESMKCGLIKQLTVGEIQRKAMALQEVRVTVWLEKEIVRLNHLRDRASEKGQSKELREVMEKLQLLSSPEERQRRLNELPEIHVDLSMHPICEAKSDSSLPDGNKDASNSGRKRRASASPRSGSGDLRETRSRSQKNKLTDMGGGSPSQMPEMNGSSRIQAREASVMSSWKTESLSGVASEISPSPLSPGTEQSVNDVEICKIWYYHDPSGKVQGPFTMMQLRKWNESGHFPLNLTIWRTDETVEDSLLLTDALNGQYTKQPSAPPNEMKVSSIDQHNMQEELKSVVTDVSIGEESCIPKESISNSPSEAGKEAFPNGGFGSNFSHLISAIDCINSREENAKNVLVGADFPSNDGSASPVRVQSPQQNESHESSHNNGNPSPPLVIEGQANGGRTKDKQVGGDGHSSQLSGQNWVTAPPIDGSTNDCDPNPAVVPLDKSLEMPLKSGETSLSGMHIETPKTDAEEMKNQVTESKHSLSSNIPVPDSGPSWSKNSSLVGCAPQVNEVSREWNMYSSAPAKLVDEWDSTLVSASSLKQAEMGSDHTATPTSGPMVHPSSSDNVPDTSGWPAIVTEPNDFSSLAEESVSDLLAEVEAMESLNGLPSPTSILKSGPELAEGGKDDCFSPVEVFSPGPTPGKRDALSSTSDLHVPSRSTSTDEPQGHPNAGKMSGGRSSVSAEAVEDQKHSDVSVNQWKPGTSSSISGPMHPRPSWEAVHTTNTWMAPSVTTQSNYGAFPGNANLGWVGANHGNATLNWDPRHGAVSGNGNANLGAASGTPGILGNQPRYGNSGSRYVSPRERAFQGSDLGFNRGRSGWSKQYSGGGGGSGGYRQPPKGQRVCKFHESGYCKKGASCSYWHP